MTVVILTVASISMFAPVFHLLKLVVMVAVSAALASSGDAESDTETSNLHHHPWHLAVLISTFVLLLFLLDRHQEYVSR